MSDKNHIDFQIKKKLTIFGLILLTGLVLIVLLKFLG